MFLKVGQPIMFLSLLSFTLYELPGRKRAYLSNVLRKTLFINISCRKAMSDRKPCSQQKSMKCVYFQQNQIFFENSHFPVNSCFPGKFLTSSSIRKDKVVMTQCCHLIFLGGLIWISNNGSSQSN